MQLPCNVLVILVGEMYGKIIPAGIIHYLTILLDELHIGQQAMWLPYNALRIADTLQVTCITATLQNESLNVAFRAKRSHDPYFKSSSRNRSTFNPSENRGNPN